MPPDSTPPEPRPAATIILVRDHAGGVEIFLMRRHDKADFANAYVFPGGMVEEQDTLAAQQGYCRGMDEAQASQVLGLEQGGLAYWVGAIRECFEEAGILLARDESGRIVSLESPRDVEPYAADRRRLHGGEIDIRSLCERRRILLAADALHYFSCWITPKLMRRRYATRFFIAAAPPHQHALHDGSELVDSLWTRPEDALIEPMQRELNLHFPTIVHLEAISGFSSTETLIAHARRRGPQQTTPITPLARQTPEGMLITIPGREYFIPRST